MLVKSKCPGREKLQHHQLKSSDIVLIVDRVDESTTIWSQESPLINCTSIVSKSGLYTKFPHRRFDDDTGSMPYPKCAIPSGENPERQNAVNAKALRR